MLKFNTLGWRKEDETSPNKILLKRHYGVDGFFRYLALRSLYGKKLSSVMMRLWVKFLIFLSSMDSSAATMDCSFRPLMVLKKSALLWCVLTATTGFSVHPFMVLIKSAFYGAFFTPSLPFWLVIFWICLHFNAGPHQTLGFKMEILWLDNCPNDLWFFNFLIFGFQLLKFSNRFRWLWKDACYLKIASAVTLRFTVSLDVQ